MDATRESVNRITDVKARFGGLFNNWKLNSLKFAASRLEKFNAPIHECPQLGKAGSLFPVKSEPC
jgi:hypothetical protein